MVVEGRMLPMLHWAVVAVCNAGRRTAQVLGEGGVLSSCQTGPQTLSQRDVVPKHRQGWIGILWVPCGKSTSGLHDVVAGK